MTDEQTAKFNDLRRAYQTACRQYEVEKTALGEARDRHDAAFRAMNDTSGEFHEFCDRLAREGGE